MSLHCTHMQHDPEIARRGPIYLIVGHINTSTLYAVESIIDTSPAITLLWVMFNRNFSGISVILHHHHWWSIHHRGIPNELCWCFNVTFYMSHLYRMFLCRSCYQNRGQICLTIWNVVLLIQRSRMTRTDIIVSVRAVVQTTFDASAADLFIQIDWACVNCLPYYMS